MTLGWSHGPTVQFRSIMILGMSLGLMPKRPHLLSGGINLLEGTKCVKSISSVFYSMNPMDPVYPVDREDAQDAADMKNAGDTIGSDLSVQERDLIALE